VNWVSNPSLRLRMLNALGNVHEKLGMHEQARSLLEEALELRKSGYGDHHPEVAVTMKDLGTVYHRQGDYDRQKSICGLPLI
jgi:tetratricopeptide (TPR) repeat protein